MSVEIISADWPGTDVFGGTTTRVGGVSNGPYSSLNLADHVGDDAAAVRQNRHNIRTAMRLPSEPLWLNQVHGTDVQVVDGSTLPSGPPTADAIVSQDGRHVLAIMTADCLPVLLCSSSHNELAAIHCGWRSLSAGIVAETISRMSSPPANLMAWLGPAITQSAFEVGDDVRDVFLAGVEDAISCFDTNENDRWQADLPGLARRYLAASGVDAVYDSELCTYGDEGRFFSYRRDGQCGRMATLLFRI